ncbi:MAG: hypothetical protein GYA55_07825 [SAR324 cluster bacterium]|uniref:Uncharacterized protein n=1 Tax=SAR324 cluster bacterium TaxID=2024889 RepID=A0A7X9FRM9_9DELT|nr:hypothetical protein [SAR324 cluster bacterium]
MPQYQDERGISREGGFGPASPLRDAVEGWLEIAKNNDPEDFETLHAERLTERLNAAFPYELQYLPLTSLERAAIIRKAVKLEKSDEGAAKLFKARVVAIAVMEEIEKEEARHQKEAKPKERIKDVVFTAGKVALGTTAICFGPSMLKLGVDSYYKAPLALSNPGFNGDFLRELIFAVSAYGVILAAGIYSAFFGYTLLRDTLLRRSWSMSNVMSRIQGKDEQISL